MNKPDFFVVGSPKCGTTSLCHFLSQHPNIFILQKEIYFFGKDLELQRPINTLEQYQNLFICNFGRVDYLLTLLKFNKPLVIIFENPILKEEITWLTANRSRKMLLASVSNSQRNHVSHLGKWRTIYNAVDTERFSFVEQPRGEPYLAFLGRLTYNKGVHLAIKTAKATGMKLKIAGNISDEPGGREYFENQIKPNLDGSQIQWIGTVNDREKKDFLGNAIAKNFRKPMEDGVLKLVFAGRSTHIKGVRVLIEAIKLLPKDIPVKADLFCSDINWEEKEYGEQVKQLLDKDSRLSIRYGISNNELLDLLANYDVCVVPSLWLETGPLTVLEAFAAGIPVVGSCLGGIAELVKDGVDGLLFEPGNSQELATIIQRLITETKLLSSLKANVSPPRTIADLARDTLPMYETLMPVVKLNSI